VLADGWRGGGLGSLEQFSNILKNSTFTTLIKRYLEMDNVMGTCTKKALIPLMLEKKQQFGIEVR
jgi:hypothetical protein